MLDFSLFGKEGNWYYVGFLLCVSMKYVLKLTCCSILTPHYPLTWRVTGSCNSFSFWGVYGGLDVPWTSGSRIKAYHCLHGKVHVLDSVGLMLLVVDQWFICLLEQINSTKKTKEVSLLSSTFWLIYLIQMPLFGYLQLTWSISIYKSMPEYEDIIIHVSETIEK